LLHIVVIKGHFFLYSFFRKIGGGGGEYFSHVLKWGQPHCSHQELYPSDELFTELPYHYTIRLFAFFYIVKMYIL
jgi:hypothetical protein